MRIRKMKLLVVALVALAAAVLAAGGAAQTAEPRHAPDIPKTWDDEAVRSFLLPLADPTASPIPITSEYYYRMPVRPIYKSYPIYYPGREPRGYMEWLARQEPEIVFDASKLRTEADWVRAGEIVFDAPIEYISDPFLRTRAWFDRNHVRVTKDGVFPSFRYVVREKGKVEIGISSCAHCHSRVMPDGTVIKGAQGNFPDDRTFAYEMQQQLAEAKDRDAAIADFRSFLHRSYAAPWLSPDPNARAERAPVDEAFAAMEAITPGVCARQGTSIYYPARIPDLIGLRDRRYFDASGHIVHHSIGDLMRYAALNQGADLLASYGGFRPVGELPDPSKRSRYSDEQLYALALYLYSLEPPPNPNKFDATAARGQKVFEREGCAACHTPPLYTNNMLTPAEGFTVPEDHLKRFDVLPVSVGTDPDLTMRSRRGTGYYKVPSLKGVWYRGPFGHGGYVATLEDWFDPRRLRGDYMPTGFRGAGVKSHAVKGHEFGLELSAADRRALVAYLRTL